MNLGDDQAVNHCILSSSRFLKIYGANEKVIQDVQIEEDKIQSTASKSFKAHADDRAVWKWAEDEFLGLLIPGNEDVDVDFKIDDGDGMARGFIVLPMIGGRIMTANQIADYKTYKRIAKVNEIFIVLVVSTEQAVFSTRDWLEPYLPREQGVHFIIGCVLEGGFVPFVDFTL
jgi:hypothetical protein